MTDESEEEKDTVSVNPFLRVLNIFKGLLFAPKKEKLKWETLSEQQREWIDTIEGAAKLGGLPKDFLRYDPEKSPKIEDRTKLNMSVNSEDKNKEELKKKEKR